MSPNRGVYFLANDRVLDQAIAFLNSFRRSNPTIALCLIPFADDIEELTKLQRRYDFTIFGDLALLRRCDRMGRLFHGRIFGHYRKLAMWEGHYDEFVYIDCDTVVLESVDFVFAYLDHFDYVVAQSNIAGTRRWVWKDSIDDTGVLTGEQIAFAANTGFIASRPEHLRFDEVRGRMSAAIELAEHMELWCIEQPLLNYLFVTSGRRYTSLRSLATGTDGGDIPLEEWAGDFDAAVRDGLIVSPRSPRTLLVHWAGEWERARKEGTQIPHHELWDFYRRLPA